MNLARRFGAMARSAALWAGLATMVLCIILAGLGLLVSAFFMLLARHLGDAPAAAITGGALLVLAVIVGLLGKAILARLRRKQPSLLAEFGGTLGLAIRVFGLVVRRDPKKALIISLVAGALAEYIMSEKKK